MNGGSRDVCVTVHVHRVLLRDRELTLLEVLHVLGREGDADAVHTRLLLPEALTLHVGRHTSAEVNQRETRRTRGRRYFSCSNLPVMEWAWSAISCDVRETSGHFRYRYRPAVQSGRCCRRDKLPAMYETWTPDKGATMQQDQNNESFSTKAVSSLYSFQPRLSKDASTSRMLIDQTE